MCVRPPHVPIVDQIFETCACPKRVLREQELWAFLDRLLLPHAFSLHVYPQLAALRAEKLAAKEEVEAFTKKTYPQYNPIPVSQASVNVWGDAAWHSQPKQAVGSPSSFNPYNMNNPTWVRRQWGIDHQSTSFIPAHVTTRSREFAEAFAAP